MKGLRNLKTASLFVCALFLLSAVYNAVLYVETTRYLERILDGISGGLPLTQKHVPEVVDYVHHRSSDMETTGMLKTSNPLFHLLKASPEQVDRLGGNCGNLVRLTVALLDVGGVDAQRVHLYNPAGLHLPNKEPYVHAVLEARFDSSRAVLDPLFNIVDRKNNAFASLLELKNSPELVAQQVPTTYPLSLFSFSGFRKIRWTILPFGENIHGVLAAIWGVTTVDGWAYPTFLERPYFVLSCLSLGASILCAGIFYLL
jgi:hypothetical protein